MERSIDHLPEVLSRIVPNPELSLVKPLSVLAFWSAIAIPALYLPLLVSGLDTTQDLFVFLGLFATHVVALVLGQSHRR